MNHGACSCLHRVVSLLAGFMGAWLLNPADVIGAQMPVPALEGARSPVSLPPAPKKKNEPRRKIDIRHVKIVRGRVILVGFDNKERPLPDGLYETSDGKQIAVGGGRIRFVTLPASLAAQGKPVASSGGAGSVRLGPPGVSAPAKRSKGEAPRRGRYRVTVNGFTVHHETKDDALQLDGKRDEVYVTVQVAVVDRTRRVKMSSTARTKVMGDVNGHNGRIRAGSASSKGGIRTGDDVPGPEPWRLRGAPRGDRLPLAVWEGELVEGENSVVLIPVLWEYDGVKSAYQSWVGWWSGKVTEIKDSEVLSRLLGARGKVVFDLAELRINRSSTSAVSLPELVLGQKMDRPIGIEVETRRRPLPRGLLKVVWFSPKAVVLNYQTAEFALRNNFGKGRGVLSLRYEDQPSLEGDYTLYVQVQRL